MKKFIFRHLNLSVGWSEHIKVLSIWAVIKWPWLDGSLCTGDFHTDLNNMENCTKAMIRIWTKQDMSVGFVAVVQLIWLLPLVSFIIFSRNNWWMLHCYPGFPERIAAWFYEFYSVSRLWLRWDDAAIHIFHFAGGWCFSLRSFLRWIRIWIVNNSESGNIHCLGRTCEEWVEFSMTTTNKHKQRNKQTSKRASKQAN